jgi:endonuclease/exonuclease/phosphatase family metal-dependent hydrolase
MARYRRDLFRLAEAALVGLFFVQAVRFAYATLYAHVASASLVNLTADPSTLTGVPGVVDPQLVQTELIVAGVILLLPLLAVIFQRLWFGPALIAIVVAAGRVFITANGTTTFGVIGGLIAAGAAGLYIATIAVRRPSLVPICLVLGFAGDHMFRLYGNTADITLLADFLPMQTLLSLALFAIAIFSAIFERLTPDAETDATGASLRGEISGWGAFALGGLLYLEFAVLALPNTVAHRTKVDYITVAPYLMATTLFPLVPEVRQFARRFLGMFDGQFRGWVWFLLIGLLVVIGFRFSGPTAAFMLVFAQLMVSLSWWWILQPSDGKRNFTSVSVVFALGLFLLLTGADFFTFEYAFVRNVVEPYGSLLRAFRGMGLVVVLFATLLAGLPAILSRKRLPWQGGRVAESLIALAFVVAASVLAGSLSRPIVITPITSANQLRIGTLNLHGGYSLYFSSDLNTIEQQVRAYGVDVLLLQEVETGRMISSSVDQAAWLARQLNMQVQYFPTNEGLQGLAVLSKLPIEDAQGQLLTSIGRQTGVQFLKLRAPDQAELHIYNTQLGFLLVNNEAAAQEQDQTTQLQEIFGFISQNDPPLTNRTVLGGTFNTVPGSDIYQYLAQSSFTDPFSSLPAEKAVTLRRVNGDIARVDYLWLRQITSKFVGTAPILQSTHNMSVVEIGLLQSTGG